jgi:hypothetical protein
MSFLPVSLDELVELRMMGRNRDGQTGSQDPRGHLSQLLARNVLLHLASQL